MVRAVIRELVLRVVEIVVENFVRDLLEMENLRRGGFVKTRVVIRVVISVIVFENVANSFEVNVVTIVDINRNLN